VLEWVVNICEMLCDLVVVLRHFAVELKPMRITHASDGCSRPGVLRYPSGGRNSSQVTAATEQVSMMPTGGVQAEAIYLPFFVTDFDCGRARRGGRFHPYPWRYRL
jgi:hypothetical protein